MKFLPLLWSNLTRRKVRTICTGLSILVAFVLIGALLAIRAGFSRRADVTGADRLVVSHRISFTQPLPLVYRDRLAAIPGVAAVTYVAWFRGVYQNPRNDFPKLAVDTESWFEMYDDLWTIPQDQLARWKADRTGAIVGQELAERFGWTIGHRIPIQGTMWPKRGGGAWEFTVEGIYNALRGGRNPSLDLMFFHYAYFNETRTVGQDFVDSYRVRVTDPARADDIARQIDAVFANSTFETTTSTENAFVRAIVEQVGDVGAIVIAILGPVLFTILLVCGNTMAQAVRERTNELAVLKALGFNQRTGAGPHSGGSVRAAGRGGRGGLRCMAAHSAHESDERSNTDVAVVLFRHGAERADHGAGRPDRWHRSRVAGASPDHCGRIKTREIAMWIRSVR